MHTFRWSASDQRWIVDHGDRQWVARCIAVGWRAFHRAWGDPPLSFRFGDHWLSNDAVRQLDSLGCAVDVTVEAGIRSAPRMIDSEGSTGELPDYRGVPRVPYRPSRRDFRQPGGWRPRRLWHLPVTTGCINAKPVIPSVVEDARAMVHLNLGLDPGWIRGILDAALASEPVVVTVLRSGDVAMADGIERLRANLEHLANHSAIEHRELVDPLTAVRRLMAEVGDAPAATAG